MYKILICNDEKDETQELTASIEKANFGFKVCGVATNAIGAWDMIKQNKPHLVFVNVHMLGTKALDLIKAANAMNMHTLFAVMSRDAEFADIQKAVNCGAIGYCINPVSDSDVKDILGKAKHYIDAESAFAENELFSLISETKKTNTEKIEGILEKYGLDWSDPRGITVMVSKYLKMDTLLSDINYIKLWLHGAKIAYLVETNALNVLFKELNPIISAENISLGVSDPCYDHADLLCRINEASTASDQYFVSGKCGVYYYSNLKNMDMKVLLPGIQSTVKSKSIGKTIRFFDSVEQLFSTQAYSITQACELYNIMISFIYQYNDEKYSLIEGPEKLVERFENFGEELTYLRKLLIKSLEIGQLQTRNQTFYCIIRYINANFKNEELTLQTIACKFTINSNYVSQLFKKETGMTFTEYLTKLRLKNAIFLLERTKLPVCTIAEKSGFNDYFYFARVFKKYTGKSSTVYRELYQNVTYLHETMLLDSPGSIQQENSEFALLMEN